MYTYRRCASPVGAIGRHEIDIIKRVGLTLQNVDFIDSDWFIEEFDDKWITINESALVWLAKGNAEK